MITLAQQAGVPDEAFFFLIIAIVAVVGLLTLVAWGWFIWDATRWPDGSFKAGDKTVWIIVNSVGFFFGSWIAWLIYLIAGRPDKATREAIKAGYWQPPNPYGQYGQYPPQGQYPPVQGQHPQPYQSQPGQFPPQGQYPPQQGYPPQQDYPPQG